MKKAHKHKKHDIFEETKVQDKSVRHHYVEMGVKKYYETHGSEYQNPHEERVQHVLKEILKKWKPDTSKVLDLACGSGEVTLSLRSLGVNDITGVDPYTHEAYERRTGLSCKPISFEDIATGKLSEEKYGIIICSYAMHLAKEDLLPMLAMQMSMISNQLLIITPHKRPDIEQKWGWRLLNEMVLDRTRARLYQSTYCEK